MHGDAMWECMEAKEGDVDVVGGVGGDADEEGWKGGAA